MTNQRRPNIHHVARIEQLIASVSGSEEIAETVVDEFLLHVDAQLGTLRVSVEHEDFANIAAAAHRFKGSLSAIYALPAAARAGALEKAARMCDRPSIEREHALLRDATRELTEGLARWRDAPGGARG